MEIPRNDMLPDESSTQPDISEDEKTQEPKVEVKEDEPKPEAIQVKVEKGDKTPDSKLFAALQEERARRKELEEKIKELETSSVTSEFLDDDSLSLEGKALKKELLSVKDKLSSLEKTREEEQVFSQYPQLKDKAETFEEFRALPENSGMSFKTAAKVFLVENNLLDKPSRKGLEKPTGGSKSEPQGISSADIDRLMKTQPRKFIEMVRSGQIKDEAFR